MLEPRARKAKTPNSTPIISPKETEKRKIEILRDIQAACKRAKGQVRAFEPKFIKNRFGGDIDGIR
jgi:hypothetical protein